VSPAYVLMIVLFPQVWMVVVLAAFALLSLGGWVALSLRARREEQRERAKS